MLMIWIQRKSASKTSMRIRKVLSSLHRHSWKSYPHPYQRYLREFDYDTVGIDNETDGIPPVCSARFVLISQNQCWYSSFFPYFYLTIHFSHAVWPKAKFAALGAFIFLR